MRELRLQKTAVVLFVFVAMSAVPSMAVDTALRLFKVVCYGWRGAVKNAVGRRGDERAPDCEQQPGDELGHVYVCA